MKAKKLLSILLALTMVLSILPLTSVTVGAATRKLISNAAGFHNMQPGYEYYITKDFDLGEDDDAIIFYGDVTLDLNGHTITTGAGSPLYDASGLEEGCSSFTIKDTSSGENGKLLLTCESSIELQLQCKLYLISGTVESTSSSIYIYDNLHLSETGKIVSGDGLYSSCYACTGNDEVTGGTIQMDGAYNPQSGCGIILTGGEITSSRDKYAVYSTGIITIGGSVSIPQGVRISVTTGIINKGGGLVVQSDLENTIPIDADNDTFTNSKLISTYANMPTELQAKIVPYNSTKFGIRYDSSTGKMYLSRKYNLKSSVSGLPENLASQGGVTFTVDDNEVTTGLNGQTITATAKSVPGYTATLANGSTALTDGTFNVGTKAVTITATYEASSAELPEAVTNATYSASLTLSDNVTINLFVNGTDDYDITSDASKYKLYADDVEVSLSATDDNRLKGSFNDFDATGFDKDIKFVFKYDGETIKSVDYSVVKYCNNYKEQNTDLGKLCKAIILYNKAADIYADNTATTEQVYIDTASDLSGVTVSAAEIKKYVSGEITFTMSLESNIQIMLGIEDYDAGDLILAYGSGNNMKYVPVTVENGVITANISASMLGTKYTVYDSEGFTKSGTSYMISKGLIDDYKVLDIVPNYYYYNQLSDGSGASDQLKLICKAMYNYGVCTSAYAGE